MNANQLIQASTRQEFLLYFASVQEENEREGDGACVNRYAEWEFFLNHKIEEGHLPESARNWSCPQK